MSDYGRPLGKWDGNGTHGWRHMSTAPKDGTQVLIRCRQPDGNLTAVVGVYGNPSYYGQSTKVWYQPGTGRLKDGADVIARPLKWYPIPPV